MKNRIIAGVVVVVLALGVYWLTKRENFSPVLQNNITLLGEYKKLVDSNDPSVVRRILLVLRDQQAPEALSNALSRVNDANPEMRAVIAEVLAFYPFDGAVKSAVEKFFKDPDVKVRLRVLQFFGQKMEPLRAAFLQQYCKSDGLSGPEKEMCQYGLYKQTQNERDRRAMVDITLDSLKSDQLTPTLVPILISMAPRDVRMTEVFLKKLEEAKASSGPDEDKMYDQIYRHLAFYAPDLVRADFEKNANRPVLSIRKAAFTTVASLCPKNRWEVIRKAALEGNEKDEVKLMALTAAQRLGSRRAYQVAHAVLLHNPTSEIKALAEKMKNNYDRDREADNCDVRKGDSNLSVEAVPTDKRRGKVNTKRR